MHLSTVCVGTVTNRPRTWSSYSNIRAKDVRRLTSMNSAEEISIFKESNNIPYYNPPTLSRIGYSYDLPEKSPKKDKKWTISSLFRRKKKDGSDCSSEDETQKKNFLGRRRKKSDSKRKSKPKTGTFDHVVLSRNSQLFNSFNNQDDAGILSDPTGGFSNYTGRDLPKIPTPTSDIYPVKSNNSRESLNDMMSNSIISAGSGSADSLVRKSRRDMAKARAEARRTTMKVESSSDEDSQRSGSSLKIRSEENLRHQRDSSLNRKSRAARTERYFKRHSKDGENPHNYIRLSKSDVENSSTLNWKLSDDSNRSPSRSPLLPINTKLSFSSLNSQTSNISGISTIPPSHNNHSRFKVSNSTSNPSYKPPLSMNDYNNSLRKNELQDNYLQNQSRSISCDANIHRAPSTEINPEIMHVQFPISKPNSRFRNLSLIDTSLVRNARQPPPPPPRDPSRLVTAHYFETGRPNTYYFDNNTRSKSFNTNSNYPIQNTKRINSFNLHPSYRSTSEDHIANDYVQSIQLVMRPSSATPDSNHPQKSYRNFDKFQYLADKNPRSRKPIFVESSNGNKNEPSKDSTKKAIDFWKQIDREKSVKEKKPYQKGTRSESPQMFTCQTQVQNQVFLPSVLQNDINNGVTGIVSIPADKISVSTNSIKPNQDKHTNSNQVKLVSEGSCEIESKKRKSSNLEEALDELEAIFNSLGLGDEDLLERAEQREKDAENQKMLNSKFGPYNHMYGSAGTLSDSSFTYEPFDTVDAPRMKKFVKKFDRKSDDMACRKLNKEQRAISDPQSVLSNISYLSTTQFNSLDEDLDYNGKEPDITFDDVVYKKLKHANNTLKIPETQPPFGIPVGPITLAANSDYLHAVPHQIHRISYKPRKIPDIVTDDLAFRNLRKDSNKEPALPQLSAEDFRNNNSQNFLNKRKAVRSLSANIGSLINKEVLERARNRNKSNNNTVAEPESDSQTLTDVADAMEIARNVLKEKENRISATRKAFMSDTDTKYSSNNNDSIRESRLNFLNGLRGQDDDSKQSPKLGDDIVSTKPPHGLSPDRRPSKSPVKESTPIPLSPLEDRKSYNNSSNSSWDDLLQELSEEVKETTDRITNEFKKMEEEKKRKTSLKVDELDFDRKEIVNETISSSKENLNRQISEIEAVSEHAKLCEKLLECVVDSTELIASTKTPVEEVEQIDLKESSEESIANIVLTRTDVTSEEDTLKPEDKSTESEHDYENLVSDKELNIDEIPFIEDTTTDTEKNECKSPFEEHKAELIASFQELKHNMEEIEGVLTRAEVNRQNQPQPSSDDCKKDSVYDNVIDKTENDGGVTGKKSSRRSSNSRLPRWLRSQSCENFSIPNMSDSSGQDGRAERIARYKEERRKQLAAQFGRYNSPSSTKQTKDVSSSEGGGPRTTKASRLRTAAKSQDNISSPNSHPQSPRSKLNISSDITTPTIGGNELRTAGNRRMERDKSSKRKSNLNRSLNSEEVPPSINDSIDDARTRRRLRRRFFTPEVLEQSPKNVTTDDLIKSDKSNLTASVFQQPSKSPITASATPTSQKSKKSDLSVHMENARKGVMPSFSEIGKYKPFVKRSSITSSKDKNEISQSDKESNIYSRTSNKENQKRRHEITRNVSISDNDDKVHNRNVVKRMEELTAKTRETLARVEKLTSKTKEPLKKDLRSPLRNSPIQVTRTKTSPTDRHGLSSILKKKSIDESYIEPPVPVTVVHQIHMHPNGPVSILKRKVSQDDYNKNEHSNHTHTPPVTFSPSVVEPATTTKKKQGILKKRRSLDESQVMRHRSCSPDVANKSDSRSILKNQRRSSLEELRRTQSPEIQLQSILKRKTSRNEDDDASLNSPQGILKRKSGASSAGSTNNSPHVSITTAVILAAARGAEMVLEPENESVKPILKKKSFSEESNYYENFSDVPKPILKKKSSTDTDDCEERPKKPILKMSRNSIDDIIAQENSTNRYHHANFKISSSSETESSSDVKPILKSSGGSREEFVRTRFSLGNQKTDDDVRTKGKASRRSHTICSDFNYRTLTACPKEEDRSMKKPRPLSVHELVLSFEKSTGAIPKRSCPKRNSDRYRTQPVTSTELEASLNSIQSPSSGNSASHNLLLQSNSYFDSNHSAHSLLDFTSSLDNDSNLNSFLSSSLHNTSPDSVVCSKMSSDSAFQSLGDGLELEQDDGDKILETTTTSLKAKIKLEQVHMKAMAEEAMNKKLRKSNAGVDKYKNRKSTDGRQGSSRFSTQPVTFEEVQEAARLKNENDESEDNEADPCNLSLLERIKLFNVKSETKEAKRDEPRRRSTRFSTQPVTVDEVETARYFPALDDTDIDKPSGILKGMSDSPRRKKCTTRPKSALKTSKSQNNSPSCRSILKTDTSFDNVCDEGISCNDSGSDSEISLLTNRSSMELRRSKLFRTGETTSDGESSGGREVRDILNTPKMESVATKNIFGSKLTRSLTHSGGDTPRSIAERRAKLEESGESGWKKRKNDNITDELKLLKEKNRYNDELSEKTSLLDSRKDELKESSIQWMNRVEKSDAEKYSVSGRMEKIKDKTPIINVSLANDIKRTPQPRRFKSKEDNESSSTPVSPEKNGSFDLTRSKSISGSPLVKQDSDSDSTSKLSERTVIIPRPDNDTFTKFFETKHQSKSVQEFENLTSEDLDNIPRQQSLLVMKKNVQVPRRRGISRNPIKALANRADISNEYTEVITGVAEREKKRLNIEKLALNSNLAVEALAGLASTENFKSVDLKKTSQHKRYKEIMLIMVKGRRHIQSRLVEPKWSSINEGDNFILVTPTALYHYIGEYSNIIEQNRAADIVKTIQKSKDLDCLAKKVVTISTKEGSSQNKETFWNLLGCKSSPDVVDAGHPSEDESYETNILHTNMIYTVEREELVPFEDFWGKIPKYEILGDKDIFVFDFGSEMYVWSGKNAPSDKKKVARELANQLWNEGYNYSDCNACPINIASTLGDRSKPDVSYKGEKRPDWALFERITQHRESVLFKEKFSNWPDFSKVIRVRSDENIRSSSQSVEITAIDVEQMIQDRDVEPDLVVEGTHLGRGQTYFDEETRRLFEYETKEIKGWHILENAHDCRELNEKCIGQFYNGDSYIYSWRYRMTVKGRELNGNPSKHAQVGKEQTVFFYWQGSNSSVNEKCLAAFLTVQLDKDSAPQVRIEEGSEPAAFLRLFENGMVVHDGKRNEVENSEEPRAYIVRGEVDSEGYLLEVPCSMECFRSRSSFVILNAQMEHITIWHGTKSSDQKRKIAKLVVDKILKTRPVELFLSDDLPDEIDVIEVEEGSESEDIYDIMGNDRKSYLSLLNSEENYKYTTRLFHMSSITGPFVATEILCPHRSEHSSPYPFVQSKLYSASQPALFLIDNHHELWLWQGWWPDKEDETELSKQTGSGAIRWQQERRAAMQTAVNYWKKLHGKDEKVKAYLVWAGLEPLEFRNLFPTWIEREDVAELNINEGKKSGEKLSLEKELALLSRTTYPLAELLERPLPEGVDPTHLERYLSPADFEQLLSMTKEEFQKLPAWKQTSIKKEKGLF